MSVSKNTKSKFEENLIKAKKWFSEKCLPIINKVYPIFAFLFSLILFAIIFKLNKIFPYGNLTVSWCDMTQQTIPLLCDFKDVLSGKSSLWLSMENAGGMNFFGVYFFNLSSPFTYIIAFFDKSQISLAVNLMVALKLSLASATMAYWLKKEVEGINPIVSISLGILYGFSGWAMMYYQILSWLDTLYVFPLLLYGLKNLTEGKSPIVYILSLFACLLFHFYLSWIVVVFVCLYACSHVILKKDKSDTFAKNFILSSIISALLSALIIIPAFIQYTKSMRVSNIFDTLKNSNFIPRVDTSYPTFFCMLPFLPFIIQAVRNKKFDKYEILLLLTFIPIMVEPIAKAWQTYNYMSFPTRYGFTTIAVAITVCARGITKVCESKENDKVNQWVKVGVSALAIFLVFIFGWYSNEYFVKNKDVITKYSKSLWGNSDSFNSLFSYYTIALVLITAIFFALKYKVLYKGAFCVIIALSCCIEAGFSANVYMVAPSNENVNFNKAIDLDGLIEDDEFYRLKLSRKIFEVNLVGAMGYNSLSHYTSLTRESYMMTMKELGYSSYWMEVGSNGGTIFTDALVRHKYVVHSGKNNGVYKTDNYYVTKNDLLFPTAFVVPKDGNNEGNVELERWQIQNELFKRLTGKGDIYEEYAYTKLSGLVDCSNRDDAKAKTDLRKAKNATSMQVIYEIPVTGTKVLYFDCFDVYSNSLKEHTYENVSTIVAKDANKRYSHSTYPKQSNNGVLELGTFKDTTVTVTVTLNGSTYAKSFGVFSVDVEKLSQAVNEVNGGDFTVKKDKLSGTVTARSGDALFTSFAYDEGYRIKINGKKAKTFSLNGFLAIELQEGVNNVTMGFIPSGLAFAIVVFLLGVLALVAFVKFNKQVQEFKTLDLACNYAVFALGAFVFMAIYLMPVVVNFIGYLL